MAVLVGWDRGAPDGGSGAGPAVVTSIARLSENAQQVLRALVTFDNEHPSSPLPLKRIATKALGGDAETAAKALQELDRRGFLRTDTMGWQTGWVTALGRDNGK